MTLDQFDRTLVAALQQDATLTLDELAARAHLSRNACWTRIKRLEEAGVITRRVALVDPAKVNLELIAIMQIRTREHSADWLARFRKAVVDVPEVVSIYRMTGETDYMIKAVIPNMKAFDALYQRITARIALEDVSTSFVMETLKEETALPLDYA
jgi:Lrp/AsnC family transcriptional regulator